MEKHTKEVISLIESKILRVEYFFILKSSVRTQAYFLILKLPFERDF